MRGIAALTVVISHAANNLPDQFSLTLRIIRVTPFRPLVDGRHAVIFFFVLSGLVLTRALLDGQPPGFPIYALRRIVRLCLPAAAAVMLSAMLYGVFYTPVAWPGQTLQFTMAGWSHAPGAAAMVRQTLLIGADGDFDLDAVLWSLVHELRFSLLLPLILALAVRYDARGRAMLLIAGGMLYGLEAGDRGLDTVALARGSPVAALQSLAYLILPAIIFWLIARRLSRRRPAYPSTTGSVAMRWVPPASGLLSGFALAMLICHGGRVSLLTSVPGSLLATLYFIPCFLAGVALALGALRHFRPRPEAVFPCLAAALALSSFDNVFAMAAAAVLLIQVAGQPGRFQRLLRLQVFGFLGRISFSLYLVHLPLLLALGDGLHGALPENAVSALMIVLSIPLAWVFYHLVERPTHRLARWIGSGAAIASHAAG